MSVPFFRFFADELLVLLFLYFLWGTRGREKSYQGYCVVYFCVFNCCRVIEGLCARRACARGA